MKQAAVHCRRSSGHEARGAAGQEELIPDDILHVGESVRLAGDPSRKGNPELYANHALLPDRKEIVLRVNTPPR